MLQYFTEIRKKEHCTLFKILYKRSQEVVSVFASFLKEIKKFCYELRISKKFKILLISSFRKKKLPGGNKDLGTNLQESLHRNLDENTV